MSSNALRSGIIAAAVLASSAVSVAADAGAERQTGPAPGPATTGQAPGSAREPIPDLTIRGQLMLTPQQRQQIWQSVARTNADEQPIPRAFAPAVGQTAPPELKLTPLPQELQQMIPGIGTQHQFARLERGTILIVGEGEARLVVAMIRPDDVGAATPPSTPATTTPSR